MMMKSKILVVILMAFLVSCDNFLEETSNDLIVPKSVQDYTEFLYGEAYIDENTEFTFELDLMTDDVKIYSFDESWGGWDARNKGFGYYAWQREPENTLEGERNDDDNWGKLYHSILISNIVIDEVNAIAGESAAKADVLGEAHFIRAWSYFMLVNLYGEPYNAETAATDLGVPINDLTGMADVKIKRSSVAENYALINSDLDKSIAYFNTSKLQKDYFKANISAAYLLASRVALYQKKFEDAIAFAEEGLYSSNKLYDLEKYPGESLSKFIDTDNPELLFVYGEHDAYYYSSGWANLSMFLVSDELGSLYETGDLRDDVFFYTSWSGRTYAEKSGYVSSTGVHANAMRTAEFYLNRAEAAAELGQVSDAIDDINFLRSYRFEEGAAYEVSASTKEEAIQVVRNERRIEFCFEKHRWFDLRRWGRPSITHLYVRSAENDINETYVLEENDPAYTLPIPLSVRDYDPDMVNINRPERTFVN